MKQKTRKAELVMKVITSNKFLKISLLCTLITLSPLAYAKPPVANAEKEIADMMKFETEIAYFFGAANPSAVANHYIKAITLMNNEPDLHQKAAMLYHLTDAYEEVAKQTQLVFNTQKAAEYEYDLILAHAKKKSFEDIFVIMVNLYNTIFGLDNPQIQKAAMLRTFLYQYKTRIISLGAPLSLEDQTLMIAISRASEKELNQLLPKI